MDILKHSKTETTKFILPMLYSKNLTHKDIFTDNFLDCYLGDIDKPEYDDHLILVYNKEKENNEEELFRNSPWITTYEKDNNTFFVYEIPETFKKKEFITFLNGYYSKFTNDYKKDIISFWDSDEGTLLYSVLYKTQKAKDYCIKKFGEDTVRMWSKHVEYWHEPEYIKEIWGIEYED